MTPPPAEQFAARIFMGPALRAQPDRRLVDLVRDGNDAAFEEIVRRYRRPLDRFAAAIVGGRSEDVTQDAFSKALLALRGSEAEIELRPWLYRIVRNTALNDLRDRAPSAEELPETLPGGRSTAAEVEAREELTDLMERLRALPEPQRAAIVMRELEGLSHEEIAAALGVTGGAARQAIFRARAALRDGLGLLVPMPILRMLAEHGDDLARTGTIAAGAGASSAGGAALGGLGGGALKAGMATVLIAGAVGAGVAVEHHRGEGAGPQAAEAAPLVGDKNHSDGSGSTSAAGTREDSSSGGGRHGRGSDDRGADDHRSHSGEGQRGGSLESGSHSGPGGGPGPSDNRGSDSHNSGSGSGDRHGGSGSGDDGGSHGGSGSGDGSGGDDHSGSLSSGSGSDDGSGSHDGSGDSGSGGSGSDEISEPDPIVEPSVSDDGGSDSGSGSGGSSGSSGGSGSGDLGSLDGSSGSEISP